MPSDFWEDLTYDPESEDDAFEWEDVERITVSRDDQDWVVLVEVDGELIQVGEPLTDDEMQAEFWDDLYWWADEVGIDVDREIDYASE